MRFLIQSLAAALLTAAMLVQTALAEDADIGRVKMVTGSASVLRDGNLIDVMPGVRVYQSDVFRTGADGSLGILFHDDSRLGLGPDSELVMSSYRFNKVSRDGDAELNLNRGTLAAVAGQLIDKRPEALRVRTPTSVIAVRGTEFAIKVNSAN